MNSSLPGELEGIPNAPRENNTASESQPTSTVVPVAPPTPSVIETVDRILEKWQPEVSRIITLAAAFMEGRQNGRTQVQTPEVYDPHGLYSRPTYRMGPGGEQLINPPTVALPAPIQTPQQVELNVQDVNIEPALKQMFADAFAQLENFSDMRVGDALPLLRAHEGKLIQTAKEYIANATEHDDRPSGEAVSDSGSQGVGKDDSSETYSESSTA